MKCLDSIISGILTNSRNDSTVDVLIPITTSTVTGKRKPVTVNRAIFAMASREINLRLWMNHDWRQGGEEWSTNWGGTANLWHGTLMPRIGGFLGGIRAVEIAPGYGRLTAYLKDYCSSLILVDLAPNCIEFCRRRFKDEAHLEYFVNDGRSLPFLEDASVDFVFSFDSLVHADLEDIVAYLAEIERV